MNERQMEDGENMQSQPQTAPDRERKEFEVCFVCGKDIHSLETRHVGSHYMDYTCATPIKMLFEAWEKHAVEQIANMLRSVEGWTPSQAALRIGRTVLDVKSMQELERKLSPGLHDRSVTNDTIRCDSVMQGARNRQIRCELQHGHEGNHKNTNVSVTSEFQW